MNDISQDPIACADAWLQSGQRVTPHCVVCGRVFGEDAQRCAEDFQCCSVCRHDVNRFDAAKRRRDEIPRLLKELQRMIDEERQDPAERR